MNEEKRRFRSELRNNWDRVEPAFAQMQNKPGRDGTIARMMLAFMPVLVDVMEVERDNHTSPAHVFDALGAVCGQIIEEAIEKQPPIQPPQVCLQRMLTMVQAVVGPRVAKRKSSIIMPGE